MTDSINIDDQTKEILKDSLDGLEDAKTQFVHQFNNSSSDSQKRELSTYIEEIESGIKNIEEALSA